MHAIFSLLFRACGATNCRLTSNDFHEVVDHFVPVVGVLQVAEMISTGDLVDLGRGGNCFQGPAGPLAVTLPNYDTRWHTHRGKFGAVGGCATWSHRDVAAN